jgi:hypothetical protein
MSNPDFPALPLPGYQYQETPEDPGIRTQMENGSTIGRARFTRSRAFSPLQITWPAIKAEDKATLNSFYRDEIKGCSQNFNYIHKDPESEFYNQTFVVYVKSPPAYQKVSYNRYSATLILQEA